MPDTIAPPSRDDLKTALRALAADHPDALEQLAARWPAGLPTLKSDHDHSIEERALIADLLAEVAPEPFPEPAPAAEASTPVEEKKVAPNRPGPRAAAIGSLEDIRTRGRALPPDLLASIEEQLPTHDRYTVETITVDEAEHAAAILPAAEDVAATRLRRVHAALGAAGLDDDDHRHAIVGQLTGGRTRSSKELTDREADHVVEAAQKVETDLATLGYLEDGTPVLLDLDGFPLPVVPALDWRALAKQWGIKLADLLRQAAELAETYRVDVPKKVDQIEGPVAYRLLARHALEGTPKVAAEQQDPPPAPAVGGGPPPPPAPAQRARCHPPR